MKKCFASLLLVFAVVLLAPLAQAQTVRVQGTVKDATGQPVPGAQLLFTNKDNGQKITLKTDKKGKYVAITLPPGRYDVLLTKDGQTLWTYQSVPLKMEGCCGGERDGINLLDIDLQKEKAAQAAEVAQVAQGASAGAASGAAAGTGQPVQQTGTPQRASQLTAEQKKQIEEVQKKNEAIMAENKNIGNLNQLMAQAKTEEAAKQYDQAVSTMKQASEVGGTYPIVWANLGNYELDWAKTAPDADTRKQRATQAAADLQKAIDMCTADTTGKMQGCGVQNLAIFHNSLGNGYAEAGDSDKAIGEFQAAAKADPSGAARYYFNAGAVMTNQAQHQKADQDRNKFIDAANQEFDQAIAANPNEASSYCEKGKNLLNKATLGKDGKMVAAPGTADALNKCVELDPNSPRAEEAKQLLAAMGESVSTTFKAKKK